MRSLRKRMKVIVKFFAGIMMRLLVGLGKFLHTNHRRFYEDIRNGWYFVPDILCRRKNAFNECHYPPVQRTFLNRDKSKRESYKGTDAGGTNSDRARHRKRSIDDVAGDCSSGHIAKLSQCHVSDEMKLKTADIAGYCVLLHACT